MNRTNRIVIRPGALLLLVLALWRTGLLAWLFLLGVVAVWLVLKVTR